MGLQFKYLKIPVRMSNGGNVFYDMELRVLFRQNSTARTYL